MLCIFSADTYRGVDFGRSPGAGEFGVNLEPEEMMWFTSTPERYQYKNKKFSEYPQWGKEDLDKGKRSAMSVKLADIDKQVKAGANSNFTYNGNTYYVDVEYISGVVSSLSFRPDDYMRPWKTADLSSDGVNNVYVTLTKAGLIGLGLALLQHKEKWWDAGDSVKRSLKNYVIDPTTSVQGVKEFDCSVKVN